MKIFSIFVAIIGIVMSFSYYPQIYKIWRKKSSEEISILSFSMLAVGATTWLIYGFLLHDLTIIGGFLFGALGSWLVLILSLIYKKRND